MEESLASTDKALLICEPRTLCYLWHMRGSAGCAYGAGEKMYEFNDILAIHHRFANTSKKE